MSADTIVSSAASRPAWEDILGPVVPITRSAFRNSTSASCRAGPLLPPAALDRIFPMSNQSRSACSADADEKRGIRAAAGCGLKRMQVITRISATTSGAILK